MKNKIISLLLLIITSLLVVAVSTMATYANNPFGLYGDGNCTYFAYYCMEKTWPVTFNVPRSYDAKDWVRCDGIRSGDYMMKIVDEPKPGDLFILPPTGNNSYGHVGMITGVRWTIDLDKGGYRGWCDVVDSGMYASAENYPETLNNGCRYRYHSYITGGYFKSATLMRCVKIGGDSNE